MDYKFSIHFRLPGRIFSDRTMSYYENSYLVNTDIFI